MANPVQVRVFQKQERLKSGQPALFWSEDCRLFEAATAFINERYCRKGSRTSPRTWKNVAEAIAFWTNWCVAASLDLRMAGRGDLSDYAEALRGAISPHTKEPYSTGTIAARLEAVIEFYDYGRQKDFYAGDVASLKAMLENRQETIDAEPANELVPVRRPAKNAIRPFRQHDLRALLHCLGPTPSEQLAGDSRLCRDRVMADWGWVVGLRLSEIVSLELPQLQVLWPDKDYPFAQQAIEVLGKGNKRRYVTVPNWLVLDTLMYIEHERATVLDVSRVPRRRESDKVFLSNTRARQPGTPIGARRFEQIIETACLKANITRLKTKTDPYSHEISRHLVANHNVHDLRHTYAVYTYWADVANGNAEPWKLIQSQLGHNSLETTIKTYLRFVSLFGPAGRFDIRTLAGLGGHHGDEEE